MARLDTYAANNLEIDRTGMILQEEIAFEQGEVWWHGEEGLAETDKNDNMED
jgi:hypothetical protein